MSTVSLDDLLQEALEEKKATKGETLHGIPEWKATGNVWLRTQRDGVTELLGLFTELQTKHLPTARRLVRAAAILPDLPTKHESIATWPYDPDGRKWQPSARARWATAELTVELDSQGLHSHAAKQVIVTYDEENEGIRGVACSQRLELSNFDTALLVEPGVNIWPILDRECKVAIHHLLVEGLK